MEQINWGGKEELAGELEGLAWMGKVEVEFFPVPDWRIEVWTYIQAWKTKAFLNGEQAYIGLQLSYDNPQDLLAGIMEGIAGYVPPKASKEDTEGDRCPECGAKLHSFSRGRRGTIMHRWCTSCTSCDWESDSHQEIMEAVFPSPASDHRVGRTSVHNVIALMEVE